MIVAKIKVDGVCAVAEYRKLIPAGIIGAQLQINYAPDIWQGLHKTVVFKGAVTKDVITDADVATIPAEVVAKHGYPLRVGVYGVDSDGNIAIPTKWADLGTVRDAADPSGDTTTDPSLPVWEQLRAMIGNLEDLDTTAKNNLVAAVNEALRNGGGEVDAAEIQRIVEDYLAANPPTVTESDPTVPAWAKAPTKPTYTAAEVGALPDTYTPPNQTAQQVGADPAGTAASAVAQHNVDAAAHNDLRLALQGLSDRINAALDSDDTTLDQMSEVVAYIKSNKRLIDAITTSKVSVADIVNDLVTNVTDKPLSAAQGVVIKTLIDNLEIIAGDFDKKLDKPETSPEVGKILQVIAVNDDGTFTCAWADAPIGGVKDVQINGASIVTDGAAGIPIGHKRLGAVRVDDTTTARKLYINASTGVLTVGAALSSGIDSRNGGLGVIDPGNLNYAVKAVMCDGKAAAWTDAERLAALLRMGCTVDDDGAVRWAASEV